MTNNTSVPFTSWPGLSRPSTRTPRSHPARRDARNKSGHDGRKPTLFMVFPGQNTSVLIKKFVCIAGNPNTSWPGLSRPSTRSPSVRRVWLSEMPGTSPGMTLQEWLVRRGQTPTPKLCELRKQDTSQDWFPSSRSAVPVAHRPPKSPRPSRRPPQRRNRGRRARRRAIGDEHCTSS